MAMLFFKIFIAVLGVVIGCLSQMEVEKEILLQEKSVALPTNRAKTFQFLSRMSNYAQWFPGVASMESVDTEPMGIGKHYVEVQEVPIIGELKYDSRIIGYESPRYISFISNTWLEYRVEMELERTDSPQFPTRLHWKQFSRKRTALVQYLLAPVVSFLNASTARQAMFNLRHALTYV